MPAPTRDKKSSERDDDAEPGLPEGGPFDLARLRALVEMMEKHGLTEVCLKNDQTEWQLRRGGAAATVAAPAPAAPAAPASPVAEPAPQPSAPVAEGPVIKSPTVGTFYSSPTPDDPPFVAIGSKVEPETIVCMVEAMKVFNQIPAEISGTIAETLVNNGDSVEFGQPLFRVRPG